jgi:predicted Kef-type K+ transport protein
MPGWLQGLAFFAAVALIYLGGRYLFVPLLRIVAKTGLRELFTASSLLLVIAVSLLMQLIGLSHDMKQYVMKARETFKLQEELLAQDLAHDIDENDHSWDSERIREVIANLK